ncbi:NADP-dependent malic enzyme-like [Lingula anatina]|uniref:Malic enzyme n=1 Tax=Lingula anatina TaxID=7574 RepID=A0A1S3K7A0_LINAN|nr:NADP-dependent malic enzyme-like [Lingula anatina]|eukprot:XP_013418136.1 NADP-dependent malic enzyme-like [Lingula anatina]
MLRSKVLIQGVMPAMKGALELQYMVRSCGVVRMLCAPNVGCGQIVPKRRVSSTGKSSSKGHKDLVCNTRIRGIDITRDPKLNKGMAFTLKERQVMGLQGLLPPAIIPQDQQVYRTMQNFYRRENDLDRYIYLTALQERNEKLFYRVLTENVELMMPVVYTPTVGLACQKFGLIYRKPRGLYITEHDKGHIYSILCNWPETDVKAIVVTDGDRILGLGDLGAYGMGIPVGKLSLYTALGGIKPHQCLPILVDVGTNNPDLLDDPLYIGLKQRRTRGDTFYDLLDEFMEAVVRRYGQTCLVQFEDFGNQDAFTLLERYRNRYCTFNDDIQGTAAVAVAGVLASLRITKTRLSDNVFLFQGAGEASIGIANLIVMAMMEEGTSREQALEKIFLVDSKGLITKDRPSGGITEHKAPFAKNMQHIGDLGQIVKAVKPTALIGAAAIANVFTEEIIRDMGSFNERPIIFALSNPTSSAECTAEEAYRYTEGRCVFASGSPFDPVTVDGRTFFPGQGNNAYIFPGVALATIACGIRHISDEVFLKSAEYLAAMVDNEHLAEGRVYPPLSDIQKVSTEIATKLAEYAYKKGNLCAHYPEPKDKEAFIKSHQYSTDYESFLPDIYDWPGHESQL